MKRNDYEQQLRHTYAKLSNSTLVLSGDVSEQSMSYFQRLLNNVQPTTDTHIASKSMLRHMKDSNKYGMTMFLKHRNSSHFVLWLDALSIVYHFKINNYIFLKWDRDSSQYMVSLLKKQDNKKETEEFTVEDTIESSSPSLPRLERLTSVRPTILKKLTTLPVLEKTITLPVMEKTTEKESPTKESSIGSWADMTAEE